MVDCFNDSASTVVNTSGDLPVILYCADKTRESVELAAAGHPAIHVFVDQLDCPGRIETVAQKQAFLRLEHAIYLVVPELGFRQEHLRAAWLARRMAPDLATHLVGVWIVNPVPVVVQRIYRSY